MNQFKNTVRSDSFWLKTLFVVFFFLVYRILDLVLLLTTVGQWLFTLFTGKPNAALVEFGGSLGIYLQQIAHFLTGASQDKPFPFQDWPKIGQE